MQSWRKIGEARLRRTDRMIVPRSDATAMVAVWSGRDSALSRARSGVAAMGSTTSTVPARTAASAAAVSSACSS